MRLTRKGTVFALIALVLCGCGDGRVKPRVRIVKSGEPLQLTEDERISVAFFPAEASGTTFDAYLTQRKEDGTLQVIGKDGKGMPLGKYRVSLEHFKQEKDLFKGAYSGSKSPIVREVNGSDEIVIDLDNPTS
jgi:hypothetical protein